VKVRIQSYSLPKDGSSREDYEDAFSPDATKGTELEQSRLSMAIADGATETSFSREWANDLVAAYVQRPGRFYKNQQLAHLIRDLGARLHTRIEKKVLSLDVPWYVEQKAREGAFAAILGLTLWGNPSESPDRAVWRACAIGDCCVLQIRNGELIGAFPYRQAADFSNRPYLVSSRPDRNARLADHRSSYSGKWQRGDELLLMTDALACWFLRRWELRSDPLELLAHLQSDDEFAKLVARERHEYLDGGVPLLRNDDVTLVRCQIL